MERALLYPRRSAHNRQEGGRKLTMDEKTIALASGLMRDRETAIAEVCEVVSVSRSTLYRYLNPDGGRKNEGEASNQGGRG